MKINHSTMHLLLVFCLSLFSACATQKATPPLISEATPTASAGPIEEIAPPTTVEEPPVVEQSRPEAIPQAAFTDDEKALQAALAALKKGDATSALNLAARVSLHPGTDWYRRALFVMQQAFVQLDMQEAADAALLRVCDEYPTLADYAIYKLAEYHASAKRYSRAATLYRGLVEKHPRSLLAERAAYRHALALANMKAYGAAADAYEEFLKAYPKSEYAAQAALGLARNLTADARLTDAAAAWRAVWMQYPGIADQEALGQLEQIKRAGATVKDFSSAAWFDRARNFTRLGRNDEAVKVYQYLLGLKDSGLARADLLLKAGIAMFNSGRRVDAVGLFERLVRDYPRDNRSADALYWLAKCHTKQQSWDKALKAYQRLLERFPTSEWADDALYLSGNIHREKNEPERMIEMYRRLANEQPDSKYADSGLWWIGWSQYLSGEYEKAEKSLQDMASRYPRSFLVSQAVYWQGRVAEARGDSARSESYYRRAVKLGAYTYYGRMAADRLSRVGGSLTPISEPTLTMTEVSDDTPDESFSFLDIDVADTPSWTAETQEMLTREPQYQRSRELAALEMRKEAADELWQLQSSVRKNGAALGISKAFFELGDYNHSLLVVLRNYNRYLDTEKNKTPEDLWRLAYPLGYWQGITAAARRFSQDPYFIASIIRQESQFQTTALSPAGARGLMQVMPATGEKVARQIGLADFDPARLYDPEVAVQIGVGFISSLMKRFKGDPLLVSAAYNAGPDAVANWIGRYGYSPQTRDVFVELIPYTETRGYVKKVLRNYGEYQRIYNAVKGSQN